MKILSRLILTIFLFVVSFKSYSHDSIYIKFIDKYINIESLTVNSFRLNNKTFVLKQIDDSTIECYIIKSKRLFSYGLLEIKKEGTTKVANRMEYWCFYKKGTQYETVYYYHDEKINDEKIKTTKGIVVFPHYSIKNLDK